jgi:hypothetical protein
MGGKYHLKLNTGERPIANKYREGKMKRTLKRELKVREIVKREALETSLARGIAAGLTPGVESLRKVSLWRVIAAGAALARTEDSSVALGNLSPGDARPWTTC